MSEIWNLSALCRCCHADGNFKSLNMPYRHGNTMEVYSNMLRECLGISIVPPPIEASYSICDTCIDRLRDSNNFRKQVLECEQKFLIYCQNESSVNPIVPIKLEPEDQYEYKNNKIEVVIERDISGTGNSDECKEETSNNDDREYDDDDSFLDIKREGTPKPAVKQEDADKKGIKIIYKARTKIKIKTHKKKPTKRGPHAYYMCAVCNAVFHNVVGMRDHVREQHAPPIQCSQCGNEYSDYSQFKKHFHGGCKRRFYCKYCDKSYVSHSAKQVHENSVHTKTNCFQCDICHKYFGYKSSLRKHILYHLGLQKTCVCDLCGHAFNDRTNLNIHVMNVHEKIRRFSCDICGKKFSLKKHLIRHFIRHDGVRREQCSACPKKFFDAYDLRKHLISTHNMDPVTQKINLNAGSYKCKVCETIFDTRGKYVRHLRKHRADGALPYTCEICGKNFSNRYVLNRHVDSHTNIAARKRFPCAICQKNFCAKATLDRHVRMLHDPTSDRFATKVKCPICKMHVKNLERHQKIHNVRPHACKHCPKTYPERNALNRHIKLSHLNIRLHHCDICGKEYVRRDVLKTHIKRKHSDFKSRVKVEPDNYEVEVPAYVPTYDNVDVDVNALL